MSLATKYKRITVQGISIFFILLFTYAAVIKLQQFETFQTQLGQFPFISAFADWLIWVVPGILIIISLLFLFEGMRLTALYGSFLLMFIITLYILAVLNFAESVPCSCGGIFTTLSWTEHLLFNIGCMLTSLVGLALSYDLKSNHEKLPVRKIEMKL